MSSRMKTFYGHFFLAYGSCWLVLQVLALLTFHIEIGNVGFFGIPLLAVVYALMRLGSEAQRFGEVDMLKRRVNALEAEVARLRPAGS